VTAYQYLEEGCNLIREFAIIGFDAMAEATFRGLKSSVPQAGTRDLRIASTALAHNLIVVTANKNDFTGISGLTFEDWTA
jgi:tRNA(fMet)-specific endonuclease VapC